MPSWSTDAVVVGSGPNGLAAALTLAMSGVSVTVLEAADEIGGGTRTAELTLPGVRHDVCSAVHPMGAASPFLSALPLDQHGLRWCYPDVDLAHPLGGDRAAVMVRSLDATATALGADGRTWRRTLAPLADRFDDLAEMLLAPLLGVPRHPITLVRFGLRAVLPATALAHRLRTEAGRALWAGLAAHSIRPLGSTGSSAAALVLAAAGHAAGWPVAAGGSAAISTAMAGLLLRHGGVIETGVRVGSLDELASVDVALFDVAPGAFASIAGDRLPSRIRRAYARWRLGPGVFKVDLAVDGGVPWSAEPCTRAATVHVGGGFEQIAHAEAEVHRGGVAARPFVLVAQQHVCDPSRSAGSVHPVWAYTHVPRGYDGEIADLVIDQIEHYAPGLRDRIVGRHVMSPAAYERYNPNYVGGDISTGANTLRQMLLRPRLALDPYATGIDGVYLCSSATPPGPGVHGMCGHHAARSALAHLGVSDQPLSRAVDAGSAS